MATMDVRLRYPDGTGDPDSEGVTITTAGSSAGVYVSTERNNTASGVSRPAVLKFDPNTPGTTLTASRDWNLSADLPTVAANSGLEGIAFDFHQGRLYFIEYNFDRKAVKWARVQDFAKNVSENLKVPGDAWRVEPGETQEQAGGVVGDPQGLQHLLDVLDQA